MTERWDFPTGAWYLGDCFDVMATLPDASVDMVLCDLPYGTTACVWDSVIPFKPLWAEYLRIVKPNAAIVLTASQPFTTVLAASAIDILKYSLVWEKSRPGGFFDVKFRPLKCHEDILVFSTAGCATNSRTPMTYNPQGVIDIDPRKRRNKGLSGNVRTVVEGRGDQTQSNYPRSILKFASEAVTVHPTQKPVALFEYLIQTYTDPCMTVLDNTAGSGTTAVAAHNTGRRWICIERDEEYSARAALRIGALA